MNRYSRFVLEYYAKQAGAIIVCPGCGANETRAGDPEAVQTAYGMAANAWERGEVGADSREEAVRFMKRVLKHAKLRCPVCLV
jgi:hypothetical protein